MPPTIASPATLTLTLEQLNTPQGKLKAAKAISEKKRVAIRIGGPNAKAAAKAMGLPVFQANAANGTVQTAAVVSPPDGTDTPIHPSAVGTAVAITFAIVFAVIAVAALAVVGAVCLAGMTKGYNVDAKLVQATGGNIEVVFLLTPPA